MSKEVFKKTISIQYQKLSLKWTIYFSPCLFILLYTPPQKKIISLVNEGKLKELNENEKY